MDGTNQISNRDGSPSDTPKPQSVHGTHTTSPPDMHATPTSLDRDLDVDNVKDLPPWMVPARDALNIAFAKTDQGRIAQLWCKFELLIGKQEGKVRLTTRGRPQQIPDWMQRHRLYDKTPLIPNPSAFGFVWRAWWKTMQPGWRVEGGEWPLSRQTAVNEAWTEIMKGGQNGFVLVLLSLSWWLAATESEKDRQDCLSALEDVDWVLQQLVDVLLERQEVSEDEGDRRARKRYDL